MPTWVYVFLILAGVLFALKLMYVLAAGWALPVTCGALFVSTSRAKIRVFLDAVPMNREDLLVDLGCGDGRVLRAACKRYGARALGFEVNPLAYLMARVLSLGIQRLRIERDSFWSRDLGGADVVFCYLFPDVMERLARKMERELRSGTRVVSCNFPVPGWRARQVLSSDSSRHRAPIYVYRFPDNEISS
ncbi:MAG: class I SAM-dependent methyltransferase [Pseudomonadota bacterium]